MPYRSCYICKTKKKPEEMRYSNCKKAYCSERCRSKLIEILIKDAQSKVYDQRTKVFKEKHRESDIKSKSNMVADIQARIFNPYIKLRDRCDPCISCGKYEHEITNFKQWEAGHYLSVGARKDLRFNYFNCNKQCSGCNRAETGNRHNQAAISAKYRVNLIAKYGLNIVEELEKYTIKRYSMDQLERIKKWFNYRKKQLEAKIENG